MEGHSILRSLLLVTLLVAIAQATTEYRFRRTIPVLKSKRDFQQILPCILDPKKKLALFLDYDGTLAAITPHPDDTTMPKATNALLRKLSLHPEIFMVGISGRGLENIKKKFGVPGITYAGNHGIEIEHPDGTRADYKLPAPVRAEYKKLLKDLTEKVAVHNAWIEDKDVTLTYHYQDTPAEYIEELRNEAIKIIEAHGYIAKKAHNVIEGRPPVSWDKGAATLFILEKNFGKRWYNKVNVFFVGDDTTDEDAMRVLQKDGKTFRISSNPRIDTYAHFRLPNVNQTYSLLKALEGYYFLKY